MNDTTRTSLDDYRDAKAKQRADLIEKQREIDALEKKVQEVEAERDATVTGTLDTKKWKALGQKRADLLDEIDMRRAQLRVLAKSAEIDPDEVRKIWDAMLQDMKKKAVLAQADYAQKEREAKAAYLRCLALQEEAVQLRQKAADTAEVKLEPDDRFRRDEALARAGFPVAPACVARVSMENQLRDRGIACSPDFIFFTRDLPQEQRARWAVMVNTRA